MGTTANYYELLRVPTGADADAIRQSFRTLIRKWHPDCVGPGSADAERKEQAVALIEAYRTLSHPERRRAYDRRRVQIPMAPGTDRRRGERRATPPPPAPARFWEKQTGWRRAMPWALAMMVAGTVSAVTLVPALVASDDLNREVLRVLILDT
jgi:curved DNA-binding protein CbpA